MKICSLYASAPSYDNGLGTIMRIIYSTLNELGVEIEEINLIERNIPYFIGMNTEPVRIITEKIRSTDAIIFATTSQLFLPSAIMKTLFDYFEMDIYKALLEGKNCMIVTTANTYGERETADYISRIISLMGGNEAARIALGGNLRKLIGQSSYIQEIIEKNVEDFYRIFRQNKKYFISSESELYNRVPNKVLITEPVIENAKPSVFDNILNSKQPPPPPKQSADTSSIFNEINDILGTLNAPANTPGLLREAPPKKESDLSKVNYQQVNFDSFAERQQDDIKEISKLFSQKLNEQRTPPMATYAENNINVIPRTKTVKQMTFSLTHYFQPQLATDLNVIIQINITGNENFECYLTINEDCTCTEGIYLTPSLTILSNSAIWSEILKGKFTAQKAFMTGQLKVRGDFMLLNKFDQIFKKM